MLNRRSLLSRYAYACILILLFLASICNFMWHINEQHRMAMMLDFPQIAREPSENNRTDYNILIVTPFADTEASLRTYLTLVNTLNYPHEQISVAIGHDSGFERAAGVRTLAREFRKCFHDLNVYTLEVVDQNTVSHYNRHTLYIQGLRRRHLAVSRNNLLFQALSDKHDWVLWIDADLVYIPPNLIQLLLSPNAPIVTPMCAILAPFSQTTYDCNNWRETNESLAYIQEQTAKHGDDFVMFEYGMSSMRKYLIRLKEEGPVVPLDGVGGCTLLVNATCHRRGLIFPTVPFDSHIETEGLAKLAHKMGIPIFGLTTVHVFHDGR